jgi:hypothetical protein
MHAAAIISSGTARVAKRLRGVRVVIVRRLRENG